MSRLASFQGPSTPSRNPVSSPEQAAISPSSRGKKSTKARQNTKAISAHSTEPSSSPSTPTRRKGPTADSPTTIAKNEPYFLSSNGYEVAETTVHKRLRQTLLEIRSSARGWDELIKVDGFRAAKEIVDARTMIENALGIVPKGRLPSKHVVGPNVKVINDGVSKLDAIISSLELLLYRLKTLVESLDILHIQTLNDFHDLPSSTSRPTGPPLNPDAPLWITTTWSLARFCALLPALILPYHHRSLLWHQSMAKLLSKSNVKWEQARAILASWRDGDYWTEGVGPQAGARIIYCDGISLESGWSAELEEICAVEIHGWK